MILTGLKKSFKMNNNQKNSNRRYIEDDNESLEISYNLNANDNTLSLSQSQLNLLNENVPMKDISIPKIQQVNDVDISVDGHINPNLDVKIEINDQFENAHYDKRHGFFGNNVDYIDETKQIESNLNNIYGMITPLDIINTSYTLRIGSNPKNRINPFYIDENSTVINKEQSLLLEEDDNTALSYTKITINNHLNDSDDGLDLRRQLSPVGNFPQPFSAKNKSMTSDMNSCSAIKKPLNTLRNDDQITPSKHILNENVNLDNLTWKKSPQSGISNGNSCNQGKLYQQLIFGSKKNKHKIVDHNESNINQSYKNGVDKNNTRQNSNHSNNKGLVYAQQKLVNLTIAQEKENLNVGQSNMITKTTPHQAFKYQSTISFLNKILGNSPCKKKNNTKANHHPASLMTTIGDITSLELISQIEPKTSQDKSREILGKIGVKSNLNISERASPIIHHKKLISMPISKNNSIKKVRTKSPFYNAQSELKKNLMKDSSSISLTGIASNSNISKRFNTPKPSKSNNKKISLKNISLVKKGEISESSSRNPSSVEHNNLFHPFKIEDTLADNDAIKKISKENQKQIGKENEMSQISIILPMKANKNQKQRITKNPSICRRQRQNISSKVDKSSPMVLSVSILQEVNKNDSNNNCHMNKLGKMKMAECQRLPREKESNKSYVDNYQLDLPNNIINKISGEDKAIPIEKKLSRKRSASSVYSQINIHSFFCDKSSYYDDVYKEQSSMMINKSPLSMKAKYQGNAENETSTKSAYKKNCSKADLTLNPKINICSKRLNINDKTSKNLNQDAINKRRNSLNMEKRTKSIGNIKYMNNNSTRILAFKLFELFQQKINEFFNINEAGQNNEDKDDISCDNKSKSDDKDKEKFGNKDKKRFGYLEMIQFLKGLNFIKSSSHNDNDSRPYMTYEKILLDDLWTILRGEKYDGVNSKNLLIFLLAICGLNYDDINENLDDEMNNCLRFKSDDVFGNNLNRNNDHLENGNNGKCSNSYLGNINNSFDKMDNKNHEVIDSFTKTNGYRRHSIIRSKSHDQNDLFYIRNFQLSKLTPKSPQKNNLTNEFINNSMSNNMYSNSSKKLHNNLTKNPNTKINITQIGKFDTNENISFTREEVYQLSKIFNLFYFNRLHSLNNFNAIQANSICSKYTQELTFKPEILNNSRNMANHYRIKQLDLAAKYFEETQANMPANQQLTHADLLFYQKLYQQNQLKKMHELQKNKEVQECTFKPKINELSRPCQEVEEDNCFLSKEDNNIKGDERILSGDSFYSKSPNGIVKDGIHREKVTKKKQYFLLGKKRTDSLYSLAKPMLNKVDKTRFDVEYEKSADQCTFTPNLTLSNSARNPMQDPKKIEIKCKNFEKSIDRLKKGRKIRQFLNSFTYRTSDLPEYENVQPMRFNMEKVCDKLGFNNFKKSEMSMKLTPLSKTSQHDNDHDNGHYHNLHVDLSSLINPGNTNEPSTYDSSAMLSSKWISKPQTITSRETTTYNTNMKQTNRYNDLKSNPGQSLCCPSSSSRIQNHPLYNYNHNFELNIAKSNNPITLKLGSEGLQCTSRNDHDYNAENPSTLDAKNDKIQVAISKNTREISFDESEKIPLFYVDINLDSNHSQRIIIHDGDTSENLAIQFAKENDLDDHLKNKLRALLEGHICTRLNKIEEGMISLQSELDRGDTSANNGK